MAFVHFSDYTSCAFLIVRDGGNPQSESDSVLVDLDWDWPGIAGRMGWSLASHQVLNRGYYGQGPCEHSGTDGTIDCPDCGLTPTSFIREAGEHIRDHAGESFPALNEYFGG